MKETAAKQTIEAVPRKRTIAAIEDLLDMPKPEVQKIFIKTLGAFVYMRKPSAAIKGAFEANYIGDRRLKSLPYMKMDFCQIALCKEDGSPMFPIIEEARKILGAMDNDVIEEMAKKAEELLKISKEDVEEEVKK